jgi:DNA polymerase delta subunit 3
VHGFLELLTGTTLCGVLTYAVTEDYSSYESVDEEDVAAAPPVKPAKGKGKKAAAPIVVKDEGGADEEKVAKAPLKTAASTLKRKPSKPSVQKGGIASYFTKK